MPFFERLLEEECSFLQHWYSLVTAKDCDLLFTTRSNNSRVFLTLFSSNRWWSMLKRKASLVTIPYLWWCIKQIVLFEGLLKQIKIIGNNDGISCNKSHNQTIICSNSSTDFSYTIRNTQKLHLKYVEAFIVHCFSEPEAVQIAL